MPLVQRSSGLRLIVMWNTRIELLRAPKICQRLTPATHPPIEQTHAGKVLQGEPQLEKGKLQVNVISSPCFIVDKFKLSKAWEFRRPAHMPRQVWCLVAIGGCGVIQMKGVAPLTFSCGEAVVVPASVERFVITPQWELEFLCASVPAEKTAHPQTTISEVATGGASI